ncbi:conserved hypothetical protein [Anaeromyxobacter dehalogenans 2CP-1]|uniref:Uncharacterized protein n=1 Tax=Anaeromyxobacter dehalogenans (strain ATCC BAA-258 / DSM 21875 / 2CP-1) TaxID=455488 RepID=B8J9N9_ANAD2|nr:LETM1 domain-containing protein [Anaeromyxobacter dehalogenans]ACL67427.1 conserved hypothetical protein [Anaeromyxobacter dehalogenans 2CP-1]
MAKALSDKSWLEHLLAEELKQHDPEAARARLPADVRAAAEARGDLLPAARLLVARSLRRRRLCAEAPPPEDAFLDEVRTHVGLALDLALLRGEPFLRTRQRAEIAAFLAAALGLDALALEVEPEQPGGSTDRAVERALRGAAEALQARAYPAGDPVSGLPLHPGATAILRRRLARVVLGFHRAGRLDPEALARHGAYAARESVLLAEALSGLLLSAGSDGERARGVRVRQLPRLGLSRVELRDARRVVASPRAPEELAAAAPERVRPFLLEQLLLAQLRVRLDGDATRGWIERFATAAGLDAQAVATAQVEAAAQHCDHEVWFEAFDEGGVPVDWQVLADEWESVADHVVERVSTAVTDNLGSLATEIRETGELGGLLAKAAAGKKLDAAEKRKVKAQLIDLAKAVPALAIFAAPGGMLLLPLLAKLLPFNLMPSAWDRPPRGDGAPAPGRASAKPAAATGDPAAAPAVKAPGKAGGRKREPA